MWRLTRFIGGRGLKLVLEERGGGPAGALRPFVERGAVARLTTILLLRFSSGGWAVGTHITEQTRGAQGVDSAASKT